MEYCIALTTAGSETEAEVIASALIEENLAACVSIHPIKSVYLWKGNLQRDAEWQLVIKTHVNHFETLCARVTALHSYDVPELVLLPIEQGSAEYLSWLAAQVGLSQKVPSSGPFSE
ncbi:MAG: divalent-cation tolerance protein CutA [Cyanobacteria bacterium P01_D01_bin.105]